MKKNSYNATLLLASALVLISSLNALPSLAQDKKQPTVPKLIVGIAVDQLRTDYLYALQHKLSDKGLKRLLNEGLVYENVTFDLDNPDATATLAVLATGTYPFYNGIPSTYVFNQQMLRRQSVFYDQQYIGNSTAGTYSPKALIGTNIADEMKIASSNASRIYSIAPDAESAIIAAGHSADCALWLDDKTGQWASTTYYKEFPNFIARQNYDNPLFVDASKATWKNSVASDGRLDIMPYHYETTSFSHNFTQKGKVVYQWIKTSPVINDAITALSKMFIKNSRMGQGKSTDMLQLTFYAGTFMNDRPERFAEELQDIYIRLDRNIADLLNEIDIRVGLSNAVVYLTSTGETNNNITDIDGTLQGEFNGTRCAALLNSYLISLYGQGNWVDGFDNNQIYLNHKTIEDKGVALREVQKSSAEFVDMFSGVSDVVYAYQLLHEDFGQRIAQMRNGYHKAYGGDLLIQLQPGWVLKVDDNSPSKPQVRHDVAPGPAIIFAPGSVSAKRISTPVDGCAIAPTVAKHIRIRAPSGSRELPLQK